MNASALHTGRVTDVTTRETSGGAVSNLATGVTWQGFGGTGLGEAYGPASPRAAPMPPALDTTGFVGSNDNLAAANDNRPDPARYPQQRVLMTDSTKTTVWSAAYEPFGRASSITGPATQNLGLPGQWFQLETGLAYNWHRHYDPTTGRYTTADPLGFVDGPSIYAYAGNNPHRWVDERGLLIGGSVGASAAAGPNQPRNAQKCSSSPECDRHLKRCKIHCVNAYTSGDLPRGKYGSEGASYLRFCIRACMKEVGCDGHF